MTAQIIEFPAARVKPAEKYAAFPFGIEAARRLVRDAYEGVRNASAEELARRHERISDAWHVGIPVGMSGRGEEAELYREHERDFFKSCLTAGVSTRTVAEAMRIRGSSKVAINATFNEIGWQAGYKSWVGYAAYEAALSIA